MSVKSKIKSAVSKVKQVASNIKTGLRVVKDAAKSFTANVGLSSLASPYQAVKDLSNAFSSAKNVVTNNSNKSFQVPLSPAQTRSFVSAFSPASAGNPKSTSGNVALGPVNRPAGTSSGQVLGTSVSSPIRQTASTTDSAYSNDLGLSSGEFSNYSQPRSFTVSADSLSSQSSGGQGAGTGQMSLPSTPAIFDPSSDIAQGNAGLGVTTQGAPVEDRQLTPYEKAQQDYIKASQDNLKKTDQEYADAQDRAYEQSGVEAARQQKQNTQNKLNVIQGKMDSDLANMRVTAGKEGVVEAVYGAQSSQIKLEAAAQIYPLQAQLAMDDGDLNQAEERLDRLSNLYTKQVDRRAAYREDIQKFNWDFFTAGEKRQLDAVNKTKSFQEDLLKDEIDSWRNEMGQALKDGNKTLYNYLGTLNPPVNIDAPNYQREVEAFRKDRGSGQMRYGTGTPTTANAGQYSQALSVILGSGKFTKDQKASVINAINNGEDPATVIKNQAKDIMGQTLATDLSKYETARDQIDDISSLLSQYYANGGNTGIFTGNYEKTINKLGEVNNPNLVSLATNISSALQIYRNAVSGTAYSVQEGKDIASIFPGINKSQGLNQAILAGRKQAFETTIDSKYRTVLGSSYDSLKKSTNTTTKSLQDVGVSPEEEQLFNSVVGSTPSSGGGFFSNLLKGLTGQ